MRADVRLPFAGLVIEPVFVIFAAVPWHNGAMPVHRHRHAARLLVTCRVRETKHFHWCMLKPLARQQEQRHSNQAPKGFLSTMKTEQQPPLGDIRFVTQQFCAARYREMPLDGEAHEKVDRTLERIGRI